ncbi:hypothetical protein ANAPC5_01263 [Anaplasma phagocytophilum]|nr:hypothetical protein ANAPC5_01263 [Anaplasma phagocytophilum]
MSRATVYVPFAEQSIAMVLPGRPCWIQAALGEAAVVSAEKPEARMA